MKPNTRTIALLLAFPRATPGHIVWRQRASHHHRALVAVLKEEGCDVLEKIDESEYGTFAWVMDPEGNKVELWQPPQGQ